MTESGNGDLIRESRQDSLKRFDQPLVFGMCPDKIPEHFFVMDDSDDPVMQPHPHRPNRQGGMNFFCSGDLDAVDWPPIAGRLSSLAVAPLPAAFHRLAGRSP